MAIFFYFCDLEIQWNPDIKATKFIIRYTERLFIWQCAAYNSDLTKNDIFVNYCLRGVFEILELLF